MPIDSFVSDYGWLIAPGDHVAADYSSPTVMRAWQETESVTLANADKQQAYGQWIAQLLQSQLHIDLVPLYYKTGQSSWPITLRQDVITQLDKYFQEHTPKPPP